MSYTFGKRKNISQNSSVQNILQESKRKKEALPNSMMLRIMEDQQAENEAEQLSKGVTATTPDEIMREMGSRLGADFSNVQFHSDSLSVNRSRAMGARAYAQGSNIYFGKGGFDPKIAAHELVHTVQQGAVHGNTTQSAPSGSVQLFRGEDDNAIHRLRAGDSDSNLDLMTRQKNSSEYGPKVFSDLKKPIKKLAEKSGSRIRNVDEDNGIAFLANLGERDYSGKAILRDIATRTVINKDEMYDRVDEYESFVDFMKQRTNKVGLEAASLQAGILNDQPKYNHNNDQNSHKRAYEISGEKLSNKTFNPTNDAEIQTILDKIDAASNEKEAYHAFLGYTQNREYTEREANNSNKLTNYAQQPIPSIKNAQGVPTEVDPAVAEEQQKINDELDAKIAAAQQKINEAKAEGRQAAKGSDERNAAKLKYDTAKAELEAAKEEKVKNAKEITFRYQAGATVNVPLLKLKLKNMVRQIRDYPELKHKIGEMNIVWNQKLGASREETSEMVMSVLTHAGAREPAAINYDAYVDRDSPEGQDYRDRVNDALKDSIGHTDKVGNHELGHVLESTLNPTNEDQKKGTASNDILKSVISNPQVMEPDELSQVEYMQEDGINEHKKKLNEGRINTESKIFKTKKMTSKYGQSSSKEWFAEAFQDVYTKGAEAKKTSIEIVKEYERRSTEKQKQNFRKKERGRLTRIGRWFSKLFNYGARH